MEPEQGEERQVQRKRRTLYLVAGGALSLILPLLGALYLKLSETPLPAASVDAAAVFARREGLAGRVQPAGAPAPPGGGAGVLAVPAPKTSAPASSAPGADSGLSMIRGGQDYYQESPAAAPAPAPAARAPAPPPAAPRPIPEPKPAAPAASSFSFAKLKPAAGFGSVKSWFTGGQTPAPPSAPAGQTPDVGALMNSMKNVGNGVGTAAAPAVPDINSILKSMPSPGAAPNQQ